MEKTLKELQEYQLAALRKGIAYDINLYVNNEQIPDITVRLSYSITEPVMDIRTFSTTFENGNDTVNRMKMGRIKKFINDIDKEQ